MNVSLDHTLVLCSALALVVVELLWVGCASAVVARSPFGKTQESNGLYRLSVLVLCYLIGKWLLFIALASVSMLTMPAYIAGTFLISATLLLPHASSQRARDFFYSSLEDIKPFFRIPLLHPLSVVLVIFCTVTVLQQWMIVNEANRSAQFTSGVGLKAALYVKHRGFFSQSLTNYWDFKQATPGNLEAWYATFMVFRFDFVVRIFNLLLYALIPLPIIAFRPRLQTNTSRWIIALVVWSMPPLRRSLISCSWDIPLCFLFVLAGLSTFSFLGDRSPKHLVILGCAVGLALGIHPPTAMPLLVLMGYILLSYWPPSKKLAACAILPLLGLTLPWLLRNIFLEGLPWAPYLPKMGTLTSGQSALTQWLSVTPMITSRTDGLPNQLIRLFFLADHFEMGPIVATCFYYCGLSACFRLRWYRQEILSTTLVILASVPWLVTKSIARLAENGDISSYLLPSLLLVLFFVLRAKVRDTSRAGGVSDDPHEILFALILSGSLAYRATQITEIFSEGFLNIPILIGIAAITTILAVTLLLRNFKYIPWSICVLVGVIWLTDCMFQKSLLETLSSTLGLSRQQAHSVYYTQHVLAVNNERSLVWHSPPLYLLLGRDHQNELFAFDKPLEAIRDIDLKPLNVSWFLAIGSPLQTRSTQLGTPIHTDASWALFPLNNAQLLVE